MSETYPAAPLYENLLWHRLFLDSCRNWCSYVLNTILTYTARKNVYQRTILPRACIQLRRIVTAANCTPARKFLASLS